MQIIVDYCLQSRPSLILECSSGLTSLMLARCCQINAKGHVISLEDGEEYAANTRAYINRYGLEQYASIIHAPLHKTQVDGVDYLWYQTDAAPDEPIDMLVIDGPSGFIQKNSRYPALPLLYSKLADGCRIFLDDAARHDEQEILSMWQAAYPEIKQESIETARGCAVLSLNR